MYMTENLCRYMYAGIATYIMAAYINILKVDLHSQYRKL